MRRQGPALLMLLALILAGVAAWAAHQWIRGQAAAAAANQIRLAPVLTASRDLDAGQLLEDAHLRRQSWPVTNLPAGYLGDPKAVVGRVLKAPVVAGEVILAAKLAPKGLSGGLSAVVPEGFRAMTVRVDEVIGVGGFVRPGDRVDVLVSLAHGPFRDDPVGRVVLQDVPVLTVGERVQETTKDGKPQKQKAKVATLQVKPEQAERLALASAEGKILLALRNQGDHATPDTAGVRLTLLAPAAAAAVQEQKPAAPAQPKAPKNTVEIIKGVTLSSQTL